jgi:DNA-binding NarL/FixJ family response regulator
LKVLIVDDDALIREGLKILIDLESDLEVVGTAINGIDALEKCKLYDPDIVLMDIRMPVLDGVLGTKLIKEYSKNIKVVILTTFKDDEYIKEALKNGASGYVLKNQSSDSIIECLRAVAKGNTVFESEIADTISSMLRSEIRRSPSTFNLSEREFDILKLIGEGLSNKEISVKLFLSEGTVRNYVTELLEKLEFRDRTQLAIFYLKNF